ncbi:n4-beta-n-acetylglucosaminyl-l-asparaginase precursor [Trichoderma cornu-damae]|uniref:N4-beta-n-acetylglucosaminyl-l-asparaginase n=1 Tax=Trichoderma cornu-damae TaxID=654480 RepID=A0A9P8TVV4_9HYPO|nr:n4-beta-n-acetylglucosaminyl-l-asparaginase precursor [Trichoderma cornu-damae]
MAPRISLSSLLLIIITTALILLSLPTVDAILSSPPLIVNTWSGPFVSATDAAFFSLANGSGSDAGPQLRQHPDSPAVNAVQAGCQACQSNRCDGTVGFGGSPDESCETTLDALIMDGRTMKVGAVANLRRVKDAIGVARHVLDHTRHTLLAGEQATQFALENGFAEEGLSTEDSLKTCHDWQSNGCQPNYRLDVVPDPLSSCGPYSPVSGMGAGSHSHSQSRSRLHPPAERASHDTLSLIALHSDGSMAAGTSTNGSMAAGTSTNGASHKIPGRVGDGPIAGSGSYVDSAVGGCGATGDGDIMMRFLPCYQAVESMRRGMTPLQAAEDAVRRIISRYPDARTGIVVVDNKGEHAAAASGWEFSYSYRGGGMERAEVVGVRRLNEVTSPDRVEL